MKLYVWHNVLKDYSYGIAFAYAGSLEEAIAQLEKEYRPDNPHISHYWSYDSKETGRFCGVLPEIHSDPVAFSLNGGG